MKHSYIFSMCTFLRRKLFLLGLLLSATLVSNAQTTKTDSLKTAAGKIIRYNYLLLPAGEEGQVKIVLPAESLKVLGAGDELKLSLPIQDGLMYDLSTMKVSETLGLSPVASRFFLTVRDVKDAVYFTCQTKKTSEMIITPVFSIITK